MKYAYLIEDTEQEVALANRNYEGILTINETADRGYGLFASKNLEKGDLIMSANCILDAEERDSHSVQKSWKRHVIMDLPSRFINHSCDASVGIRDNDQGAFDFFALQAIPEGEELTWDYGAAEFDSISFGECLCGSPKCRGAGIGFEQAHAAIRRQYGEHYATYLHAWQA